MKKRVIPSSSVHRLLYPRNVVLVSCMNQKDKANLITLSWCTPTSFNPPMVAISVGHQRYSHNLIEETKEFVVNIPTMDILKDVLLCGRTTGKTSDKLAKTLLTPFPAKRVKTPIIKECAAHIECKLIQQIETGDHTLFVGEVLTAYSNEGVFDGSFDLREVKPIYQIGESEFTTVSSETVRM
jgi:flavin reductase (DIM6/NTAB) family NADH-FMN oxidoreductase RutF